MSKRLATHWAITLFVVGCALVQSIIVASDRFPDASPKLLILLALGAWIVAALSLFGTLRFGAAGEPQP